MDTLSPHADNGNIPEKRCTGPCGRTLPATLEHFHSNGKRGLGSQCKECKNRKCGEYNRAHRQERNAQAKRYRQENAQEIRQKEAMYNRTHTAQKHTYNKAYHQAHLQERRSYYKAYQRAHLDQYLAHNRNRIARQLKNGGTHTTQQIQEQYARQKGKCYYCQHKVAWGKHHVDHVIPLSRGGSNDISNLVIACAPCNINKRDKLLHEWPEGGRLL